MKSEIVEGTDIIKYRMKEGDVWENKDHTIIHTASEDGTLYVTDSDSTDPLYFVSDRNRKSEQERSIGYSGVHYLSKGVVWIFDTGTEFVAPYPCKLEIKDGKLHSFDRM